MSFDTDIVEGVFDLFFNAYQSQKKYQQSVINAWATFRVTLGSLIISGYRLFKHLSKQKCLIFFKRQSYQTKYLFFQLSEYYDCPLKLNQIQTFIKCIEEMNELLQTKTYKYSIMICYGISKISVQIFGNEEVKNQIKMGNNLKISTMIQKWGDQLVCVKKLEPDQVKEQELLQDSEDQFKKLKDILYHYVDTFGSKYKTNYYKDLEKKCLTSYNINNLINTINIIIYEETRCHHYDQIESSVWTAFRRGKNQLESDRKDLVLSGNGCILVIDIIFMKDLKKYICNEDYQNEVKEVLGEYRKSHTKGKVKVIKISNQLNKTSGFNLSYQYQSAEVDHFS